MMDILVQLREGRSPGAGDLKWMVTDVHRAAADEIAKLRGALAKIVKHMDDHGMGDWPVAKEAKAALR